MKKSKPIKGRVKTAASRNRKAKEGFVRVECLVHIDDKEQLKKAEALLLKQRGIVKQKR